MVAFSVLAAVAVALFGASPAFAADGTTGPKVSKTVTPNIEQTGGTVALSVTGSSSYTTTSTSANVIFVVDVSRSMKGNRLTTAKSAIKAAASTILEQKNTKVSLVSFSNYAHLNLWPTNNINDFNRAVGWLSADGGTNWEAGLSAAENLVSNDSNTKNYVIFVSDGNPTFRISPNGYSGDHYYNYVDEDGNRYNLYGDGNYDTYGYNFNAADAVAKRLVDKHVTLYNINAFGDATNMQSLGGISSGNYFNASDSAALQWALGTIVQDIVNAHDYRNVTMTDTISDAVASNTPDGNLDGNSVTVSVKDENGHDVELTKNADGSYSYTKDGVPKSFYGPTVSGKTVTWNLGGQYKLENGWTYTASFDVLLKQDTLNKAADLLNGKPVSDSNLTKENGVVEAYTNTDSGNVVSYIEQTTVNNVTTKEEGTKPFGRPSITVPTASALTVSKKVSGGAANTKEKFNFVLSNKDLAGKTYGTGDAPVTFDPNGDYKFPLAHGESISVAGLPVGATLTLQETGLSGNAKTSTTAKVDGGESKIVKPENSNATETEPVSVKVAARAYTLNKDGKLVAPTDANTVEFTNTTELVPQTGVSIDPRPMMALLGVAVAGGVAVVAGVRKRHGREE